MGRASPLACHCHRRRRRFRPDGYYAAARLFVSLIVSWFWNFALQRYFVYRDSRFDPYAIAVAERVGLKKNPTWKWK